MVANKSTTYGRYLDQNGVWFHKLSSLGLLILGSGEFPWPQNGFFNVLLYFYLSVVGGFMPLIIKFLSNFGKTRWVVSRSTHSMCLVCSSMVVCLGQIVTTS